MSVSQHNGKLHKKLLMKSLQFVFVGHHIKVFQCMARNDGHACAQRLVNKQHFYQTSMLKFIGVTLGK